MSISEKIKIKQNYTFYGNRQETSMHPQAINKTKCIAKSVNSVQKTPQVV